MVTPGYVSVFLCNYKASDLAMGHLAGYAFGGLRPHSPQEHVDDPNVLVIHSMKV